MKLRPGLGFIFVTPIQEIPFIDKTKSGIKVIEKNKPEESLYKFKVVAVGGPRPFDGVMIDSDVKPGDIVSYTHFNKTIREDFGDLGFVIDNVRYFVMDFRDVLGVWKDNESTTDLERVLGVWKDNESTTDLERAENEGLWGDLNED